jgi:hypothetical protein
MHTSLQPWHNVMQRSTIATSGSPRQASAQPVQLCAQSKHASMQAISAPAST